SSCRSPPTPVTSRRCVRRCRSSPLPVTASTCRRRASARSPRSCERRYRGRGARSSVTPCDRRGGSVRSSAAYRLNGGAPGGGGFADGGRGSGFEVRGSVVLGSRSPGPRDRSSLPEVLHDDQVGAEGHELREEERAAVRVE